MLEFHLDEAVGIAYLKPKGAFSRADISEISQAVDTFIDKTGVLTGLLLDTTRFPAWESFDAFRAHMRFIEKHHNKVARVAVVTDSTLFSFVPLIADFFLQSEVERFDKREDAEAWLKP
jgi:hypothetical protein